MFSAKYISDDASTSSTAKQADRGQQLLAAAADRRHQGAYPRGVAGQPRRAGDQPQHAQHTQIERTGDGKGQDVERQYRGRVYYGQRRHMNRSRPLSGSEYRGSDVHDQTRAAYSTVNTTTEAASNHLKARGAFWNTSSTVPRISATTFRTISSESDEDIDSLADTVSGPTGFQDFEDAALHAADRSGRLHHHGGYLQLGDQVLELRNVLLHDLLELVL